SPVIRGSRASRKPSPKAFSDSVTRNSAIPGAATYQGSTDTQPMAEAISLPQDGVGGGTPMPRNDSAASVPIAPGIDMVAMTVIVDPRVGGISVARTCS